LYDQGVVFVDPQPELPEQNSTQEAQRQLEEASSDLRDRLNDLHDAYDRAEEAVDSLLSFIQRFVPSGAIKQTEVNRIEREAELIQGTRDQVISTYESQAANLALADLPQQFEGILRGIHYKIQKLSEYRQHYTQLWDVTTQSATASTANLASSPTLAAQATEPPTEDVLAPTEPAGPPDFVTP
jgi:chromosome segregation ATPase